MGVEDESQNKSKRTILLESILALLPKDPEKLQKPTNTMMFDLRELSKKAGMVTQEFDRFLVENQHVFYRIDSEQEVEGLGMYRIISGYENLEEVVETLRIPLKKVRNDIVRKRPLGRAALNKKRGIE